MCMRDKQRPARESDLSVWRGIVYGISLGVIMWAGILGLIWWILFR